MTVSMFVTDKLITVTGLILCISLSQTSVLLYKTKKELALCFLFSFPLLFNDVVQIKKDYLLNGSYFKVGQHCWTVWEFTKCCLYLLLVFCPLYPSWATRMKTFFDEDVSVTYWCFIVDWLNGLFLEFGAQYSVCCYCGYSNLLK